MRKILLMLAMVSFIGLQAFAQTTVTGTVTDPNGDPVPGANIRVKGFSDAGTITDLNGSFTLNVPAGATSIIFSFVGMKTTEVEISGRNVINFTFETEDFAVEEVVVVAYGTKGKVGLKGSISTVDAKSIEQIPMATFDQILQGKTTGLVIASGSGQPGTENTKVRIRGTNSIAGGNEPLYIVDGVPIEAGVFATLNANDFENVSVLKDASATSIYGSRASNGVILITTKRGIQGSTNVHYRFQTGWSMKTREKFDMMNSEQKLWFEELAGRGPGWNLSPNNPANAGLSPEELAENAAELNRLRNINTDWQSLFTRTGRTNSHDFGITGGNEKTRVYFGLQRFEQEGQSMRSDLSRTTGRLNVDYLISDKVRFGINSSLGYSSSARIESEAGVALANPFAAMYLANPYEEPFDEEGNRTPGVGKTGTNALDRLYTSTDNKFETKGIGAIFFEWDIIDGLTFKSQYGMDYRQRNYERWIDPTSYAGSLVTNGNQGAITEQFNKRSEATFSNTLDYKKTFLQDHTISILVGSEFWKRSFNSFYFTGYGINPYLPETPSAVTPGSNTNNMIPVVGGSKTDRAMFSVFGIFNYTYKGKYTFSGSIRRDGSSAFGPEYQHAYLFSTGLTWNISQEEFIKSIAWVNDLKFRLSYGTTGNQENISDYEYLETYAPGSYNGIQTMGLSRTGYPQIKWEIGQKFNTGIDYVLFKNRLRGTIDLYNNISSDLFIQQTVSYTAGIIGNQLDVNQGKMRNRGIEFLLNGDLIRTQDFNFNLGINLSYNQNEILDLGQVEEYEFGTSIIKTGLPYGTHYIVKWAGVDQLTGNPLYYTKDGKITELYSAENNVTDFGTSEAPFTGGFNAGFSYKGFEIGAQFVFSKGYSRFNNQSFFQENPNFSQFNLSTIMLEIWQNPGDITEIQRLGTEREFSSKDIEDASFLRFRNLTISYNFPKNLLQNTKFIKGARIYAQGQNLFTWTKFTGFDPEDNNNIAQYEYPASRFFTVGFDLNF